MTATVWRWMLNAFYGVMNRVLLDLHVISGPVDWLGNPSVSFAWLMGVAIFVSLPFTTYVILAGLQSIPREVFEAARVDGASPRQTYREITLPLLRPALLVATIINMINVFNSFPIIWVMTNGGPGYQTDTTTTFMYKIAFRSHNVGQSAAMAVVNFVIILVFVLLYLRSVNWRERADVSTPMRRALVAGIAYLIAFLFLAPYLEMFITALKPHDELFRIPTDYLPSSFEWDNFIKVWQEAPVAGYLKSSLVIAGCATVVVLLVSLPAAYYTARNRYRGRDGIPAARARHPDVRADRAGDRPLPRVRVDRTGQQLPRTDHRQRGLQPRVLDLDHERLYLDHPCRARGGRR